MHKAIFNVSKTTTSFLGGSVNKSQTSGELVNAKQSIVKLGMVYFYIVIEDNKSIRIRPLYIKDLNGKKLECSGFTSDIWGEHNIYCSDNNESKELTMSIGDKFSYVPNIEATANISFTITLEKINKAIF